MRFFTTKPLSLLSVLSILSLPTLAMEDGPETHPPLSPRTSARLDAYPALFEDIKRSESDGNRKNILMYRQLNNFFGAYYPKLREFREQLATRQSELTPDTFRYISNIIDSLQPIVIEESATQSQIPSKFSRMKRLPSAPTDTMPDSPVLPAKQIIDSLNEVIIGEQKAMQQLGTCVSRNEMKKRINKELGDGGIKRKIKKTNILLIGPTGCGKTACVERLAEILDVPFYIADSSTFTKTGYRGSSADSVVQELLRAANYDIEKAKRGFIFLDETDKNAGSTAKSGIADIDVQSEMLKLIEGKEVSVTLHPGTPYQITTNMSTEDISFMAGGTFSRLPSGIEPTIEDFVNIGFERELIGRFGKIITFNGTNEEKLLQILNSPKVSPIPKEQLLLLKGYNITTEFTLEALQHIAKNANRLKTGARGLSTIIEQITESLIAESSGEPQTLTIDETYAKKHSPEVKKKSATWKAMYGRYDDD